MILKDTIIIFIFLTCLSNDIFAFPISVNDKELSFQSSHDFENRRKKDRKKKRPCTREAPNEGRWFLGHDLTFVLGDITYVNSPCVGGNVLYDQPHNPSASNQNYPQYETSLSKPDGHKPIFGGHKPIFDGHKPIFGGNKPIFGGNKPQKPGHFTNNKPVYEETDEVTEQEPYKPGPIVGALNNQVDGIQQNLSNFNPTSFLTQISRHFNNIVNPFVELFF